MKKLYFDSETFIWKAKGNLNQFKDDIINEALKVIESQKDIVKFDGYAYKDEWNSNLDFIGNLEIKNKLDLICQLGIDLCKEIWNSEIRKKFNKVNTDAWINVVRSKDPKQIQFKHTELKGVDKFHTHTDIQKQNNKFYPNYTYVYYIQMPNILEDEDGVLYFRGENGKEYWIMPEEDDLIIMPGWMPHAPNNAPKATIDRIVVAGNVGFEFIKKEKSIL